MIDQAPLAMAMLDKSLCYLAVSKKWINDYNLHGQDLIGRSHYAIFPEIPNEWKKKHQDCLKGNIDICNEWPFNRLDGSVQWILWDVRPWYEASGAIGGLIMYTDDITDKKNNELAKLRTENILEKASDMARMGTWELNIKNDSYILSDMAREIFELCSADKINYERFNSFYEEGANRNLKIEVIKDCLEKGISFDLEFQIKTNKGNTRWIREIAYSKFEEGNCSGAFGIVQDITDRKNNEQNISKINQQLLVVNKELKSLLNAGPVIVSTDKKGYIKHFNKGAERLLGYSKEEMIGIETHNIYTLKEERDAFQDDLIQKFNLDADAIDVESLLAEKNYTDSRIWSYVKKDGSTVPVYVTLEAIRDDQNQSIGLVAVAIDISERIEIENELLRKNNLLLRAEEINKMGHWHWDPKTDSGQWSKTMYALFEMDDASLKISKEVYFHMVHPDDRERAVESLSKALKQKRFYSDYYRILTGSEKVKFICVLGDIILDSEGEIDYLMGTCQDVTEQKLLENKFRGLLESAPDAMVIIDNDKNIQLINTEAKKLFGYTSNELVNSSINKLIPHQWNANYQPYLSHEELNKKDHSNSKKVFEIYGRHKDEQKIPIQLSLSPLITQEEYLISLAMRDITKQNEARNKIIEANTNLEVLTQKLTSQNIQLADFAQITSHNLRSPICNLNSLLEIYKQADNDEDKTMLFEKFEQVIGHLNSNLDILVDALKIKRAAKLITKNIRFEDVLSKTNVLLAGKILESKAQIKADFSEVQSIDYNLQYLESIFLNLIDNSITYRSPKRSPQIYIKSIITTDNTIKLTFTDNGLGINMDRHSSKLFGFGKTFHRNPNAKGIGLFMTKTQIESMGGSITATSIVDEGTTLSINF
ncbi:PAS domain S-box protein [Leeuwenhoekiella aestuarii]|nr:PAS domain S-box protein [Leeuwenhoekiella aestuarii]